MPAPRSLPTVPKPTVPHGAAPRPLGRGLAVLLALVLAACTPGANSPTPNAGPVAAPDPAAAAAAPLDWERGHPERAAWSAALRQAFAAELPRIGTPSDVQDYCPAWPDLPPESRVQALSVMAVAMARRESGYDPATVYHEPPPLGVDSIGLFQLSYEDGFAWCDMDRARDTLKDPITNITCAVGEMARLIGQDGVIAQGSTRGLPRYWSVLRDGDSHFKSEIRARVQALPACAG